MAEPRVTQLKQEEVRQMWEGNSEAWARLIRLGCDIYRDQINMPAFLEMLPPVSGSLGLDIGCGEGESTRALARLGAKMAGVDISKKQVGSALETDREEPLGIEYRVASATELPFPDALFDFAIGFMSFMDIPEHGKLISEAFRVLKAGGFLQFSICHPCFTTPRWNWVTDPAGNRVALECGDYFHNVEGEIDEWIFGTTPPELKQELPKFRIPRFPRTLSSWLNLLIDTGFILERFSEPCADEETVRRFSGLADSRVVAYYLIARCRKPGPLAELPVQGSICNGEPRPLHR